MISSPTVWKNANTLTHDWEPSSSQQSLELSEDGRILVTHNLQSQIAKQLPLLRKSAPYQELMILIAHSKAVNDEVKKISEQLNSLPSTNLAEYQDKMSQYQGAINLFSKHIRFLKTAHHNLIEKNQKDSQTKNNFLHKLSFEALEEQSEKQIEALHTMLTTLRANQKVSAVKNTISYREFHLPIQNVPLMMFISVPVPKITALAFKIGSYAYGTQSYTVTISMALKKTDVWHQSETIHPASNELILTSVSTDLNREMATIRFSVNWRNGCFPLLDKNTKAVDELFTPNYISLFKRGEKMQQCSSLIIQSIKETSDDIVHINKLRQALVEWMVHYNVDQLITYDMPETAVIHYGNGFSCDFSERLAKSPTDIQSCLDHCLETRSYPTVLPVEGEEEDQVAVPYIMRNYNIGLLTQYQFEKGKKKSYAELMAQKPVLDSRICGEMPELMGISRIPFCNLFETLRRREYTGRKATPDPIAIQATKLDYRDIESPTARRECSQISEHALQTEKVQIERRNIVKVRRCK